MKIVGIEEHFITNDVRKAWQSVALELSDLSIALHSGVTEQRLLDLADNRLALMAESGVDLQVLSLTTPALHDLCKESVNLARRTNDLIAKVIVKHPDSFQALATLPVACPDAASKELERCITDLGFKGAMLCGRVGNVNLDDASLLPIFHTAEALNAPVLIHPRLPDQRVREAYYSGFGQILDTAFSTYGLGWHYDAGIQFIRLMLAGHFDRMPNLHVILGHWGELILFYAERLAAMDGIAELDHSIWTYLRRNLYVTASGMFLPHFLARAAQVVGVDRLLFSTDFPYQYRNGNDIQRFLRECGLDDSAKEKLAYGNWQHLTQQCGMQRSSSL